jgi:aprataxin
MNDLTISEMDPTSEDLPEYCPPPMRLSVPRLPDASLKGYFNPIIEDVYKEFFWFRRPRVQPSLALSKEEPMVVLYDAFAKAKFHVLVLPSLRIQNVRQLERKDLWILKQAHELGRAIAEKLGGEFQLGYHALPSLTPLHLHIISRDLNAFRMNSKKHWNSFTHPNLWVPAKVVEEQLERLGHVEVLDEEVLQACEKSAPCCQRCKLRPRGSVRDIVEELKNHTCVALDSSGSNI